MKIAGTKMDGTRFSLDPMKTPRWIDIIDIVAGKEIPQTGIYEIKADRLRICFEVQVNQVRPEEFDRARHAAHYDLRARPALTLAGCPVSPLLGSVAACKRV